MKFENVNIYLPKRILSLSAADHPPFYVYAKADARRVSEAIDGKECGTDAPGSFIAWLSGKTAVHAMEMPGRRYDIGNLASYEQVQKDYKGIEVK